MPEFKQDHAKTLFYSQAFIIRQLYGLQPSFLLETDSHNEKHPTIDWSIPCTMSYQLKKHSDSWVFFLQTGVERQAAFRIFDKVT